jgi:hypothetical protein
MLYPIGLTYGMTGIQSYSCCLSGTEFARIVAGDLSEVIIADGMGALVSKTGSIKTDVGPPSRWGVEHSLDPTVYALPTERRSPNFLGVFLKAGRRTGLGTAVRNCSCRRLAKRRCLALLGLRIFDSAPPTRGQALAGSQQRA